MEKGELSALVSGAGTLTYRARSDGSPYTVVNQAGGVYTELPEAGDKVACGGVLYRVDNRPVLLLCGTVPAYRALHVGVRGPDVRQLNRNLHQLGYDGDAHVRLDPAGSAFTPKTEQALRVLQRKQGVGVTGQLATDDAVFLPEAVRIAKVTGQLGGSARPGAPVLNATSDKLHVRVNLDASQQGEVHRGDRVQITLPGNTPVTGRVDGLRAGRPGATGKPGGRRDHPDLHRPRRPGKSGRARPGPGRGGHHHQGRGQRSERPGDRARREVRRRVRRRGRTPRRATRAGRREAGPVRHRRRASPGRGRSPRRRSVVVPSI